MIRFETRDGLKANESSGRTELIPFVSAFKQRKQSPGFASISGALRTRSKSVAVFTLAKASETQEKQERGYRILKIKGDGRCLFRALAQGLSRNKGVFISEETETKEADELRLAVRDALCRTEKRKKEFKNAVISLEATEGPIGRYCQRLVSPSCWGGEVEMLVLSKMLHTPIYVYKTGQEDGRRDGGFVSIAR
ncbi:hypothetical protein ABBQ32_008684 [Trebouxia sp. C0010 RCD-2024]